MLIYLEDNIVYRHQPCSCNLGLWRDRSRQRHSSRGTSSTVNPVKSPNGTSHVLRQHAQDYSKMRVRGRMKCFNTEF
eukprot:14955_2